MALEYRSIENPSVTRRTRRLGCGVRRKKILLIFSLALGFICFCLFKLNSSLKFRKYINSYPDKFYNITVNQVPGKLFIKGQPRKDKYGLDLNFHILDGIYTVGYNNDPEASIEDWELYTPPCPNLQPVHFSEDVINPKCEGSSLQFSNYRKDHGSGFPYNIRLDSISNQLEKWNNWKKTNGTNPMHGEHRAMELTGEDYHPFDYGYTGQDTTSVMEDTEFYSGVVRSRMDEVPDPRRRRLFSFIMFNGEFDLLDLYLAEYYEIIDYFVIYESNTTFTDNPKPLYFTRTLFETSRYDRFMDKLIPLPVETLVHEDNGRGIGFPKEHVARRVVIEKGLRAVQARHGDIFMYGDLDEMPKVHVLARMKKCGGWEHLQAGIGGGPKSFKDPKTKSYFIHDGTNVTFDHNGEYQVDYERERSLGFMAWFHEYSFAIIQNKTVTTMAHPNLSIFDARRSLGQLPDWINRNPGFVFPKLEEEGESHPLQKRMEVIDEVEMFKNIKVDGDDDDDDAKKEKEEKDDSKDKEDNDNNDDNHDDDNNDDNNIDNDNVDGDNNDDNNNDNDNVDGDNNDDNNNDNDNDDDEETQSHYDPLEDPNFDPYQGYTYTDNTNDRKTGKGYLGEYNRFATSELDRALDSENPLIWSSAWHVSSFLPSIEHFYNKISSYSHFVSYGQRTKQEIIDDVIYRIKSHFYIYGNKNKFDDYDIYYPASYTRGYEYNFEYNYWDENVKEGEGETPDESFRTYYGNIQREIPSQVWKHPICYNFMIDRDYGLEKKLWWERIPKEKWNTVQFNDLTEQQITELIPKNYPDDLKKQFIENNNKNENKNNNQSNPSNNSNNNNDDILL